MGIYGPGVEWDDLTDDQQYEYMYFGDEGHPDDGCTGCKLCTPSSPPAPPS